MYDKSGAGFCFLSDVFAALFGIAACGLFLVDEADTIDAEEVAAPFTGVVIVARLVGVVARVVHVLGWHTSICDEAQGIQYKTKTNRNWI
jgi:hypothetical protein